MFYSQKHVFWQALLITILIFSLGLIAGFVLENWRTGKIDFFFKKSEVDLLDARIQNEIYSQGKFDCDKAIEENIKFADRIYEEAKLLDRYETASELTNKIQLEHKKYDLLRALLFLNSIQIKEKCNATYYEVVYFYNFDEPDFNKKAKQNVFSAQLRELKELKGKDVLLIPIASNINASSIALLMDKYNLSQEETPIILINRDIKIKEIQNLEDLLKYFR